MGEAREAALIKAAQRGDQQAQDQLVESYLPLIYNIVGRALNGHADVDDVVQESALRMLHGLPSLRAPESFRSWFVAITMNQIRGHWRERRTGEISADPMEDAYDVVDPGADFVELTIVRLGLTGQRREAAEATRWLDEDDRALLSLWWLETAGELSRPEVAAALDLSPQHTAVRVQRMKAQLEGARVVVRALAARPRCVLLEELTAGWDGVPSALWRKRLARHARDCTVCSGHGSGMVPAEGLLVGLALVPLAASAAGAGVFAAGADMVPVAGTAHLSGPGRAERRRGQVRRRRRNTVLAGLAAVVVLGGGGAAVHLYTDGESEGPATAVAPRSGPSPSLSATESASASPSPSPSSASPSPSPSRTKKSASPTPKAAPSTRKPSPKPPAAPAPKPADPPPSSDAEEVTALVNAERAKEGCSPVRSNSKLATAASRHSADMVSRDYFSHTSPDGSDPGDRVTAAGYRWSTYGENIAKGQSSPASVMDSWMNSPGHRANIVNCAFKEIGVGKQDSSGGPVWTQVFGAAL